MTYVATLPTWDWYAQAACKGLNPSQFHPKRGSDLKLARQACNRCPVVTECLTTALSMTDNDARGVWGNTSARERRKIRVGGLEISAQCKGLCGTTIVLNSGEATKRCPPCRRTRQLTWMKNNRIAS